MTHALIAFQHLRFMAMRFLQTRAAAFAARAKPGATR